MTRRLEVTVSVSIRLPEGLAPNDYMRAVANYLADQLPQNAPPGIEGGTSFAKTWSPGRDVSLSVIGSVISERVSPFADAQFADLPEQAQGALL